MPFTGVEVQVLSSALFAYQNGHRSLNEGAYAPAWAGDKKPASESVPGTYAPQGASLFHPHEEPDMNYCRNLTMTVTTATLLALGGQSLAAWEIEDRANPELPGRRIDVRHNSDLVAALIYGEGQMKTYLHVYDEHGNQLTMSGMDSDGATLGRFPHHRGIFIGWNRIHSDLGHDDLWHMRPGGRIELAGFEAKAGPEAGTLDTSMHWRSRHAGDDANLLIVENRRLRIARPDHRTMVDFDTKLTAQRDVRLEGDLQHAGVHYRAHHTVNDRANQTAYLWEPTGIQDRGGRLISDDLKWVQLVYPKGDNWYLVTQLNAPINPTEELSWRDYGRFGFFHKDKLAAGESRKLSYQFIIEPVEAPETPGRLTDAEQARFRALAAAYYEAYVARFD